MTKGGHGALAEDEIQRKGRNRKYQRMRAKAQNIRFGAELRRDRHHRKQGEQKHDRRLHRFTGNNPEGRKNNTAAIRM